MTIAFDAYGLEETAVFKMLAPPSKDDSPQLYSIMGDLTGFAHKDVTQCPDDAHFMKNGKPTDLDVAFQNPNTAGIPQAREKTTTNQFHAGRGATWETVKHKPDPATGGQVAMSADGSSTIWVPNSISGKPYVTTDLGKTWYYVEGLALTPKLPPIG